MPEIAQYLYIIGADRRGPLKIGVGRNPYLRRLSMQTGNPEELRIFWCYPCPAGLVYERLIHRILRKHHRRGQWFNVPVEVAMAALWIASNEDETPATDDDLHGWCRHIGLCVDCETPHTFAPSDPHLRSHR